MTSQVAVSSFHPKKILVPMDFSPSSITALSTATELALQFHAELYLLHVIPMLPIVPALDSSMSFYPNQEYLADAEKDVGKRFAGITSDLAGLGVQAVSSVEIGNDVVGNVLMVLEREHADLLVISTHGMSGWRPIVFGSIVEKVVKLAECPVLLLRSSKAAKDKDSEGAK